MTEMDSGRAQYEMILLILGFQMASGNIKTAFLFLLSIVTSPLRLRRNMHASYFPENKFILVGFNADVNKITIRVNCGQGHWKSLNTFCLVAIFQPVEQRSARVR